MGKRPLGFGGVDLRNQALKVRFKKRKKRKKKKGIPKSTENQPNNMFRKGGGTEAVMYKSRDRMTKDLGQSRKDL